MSRCTYVSAYTPDYAECANQLGECLTFMGLQSHMYPIDDTGEWVKNCAKKPEVLQSARQDIRGPIVWTDADSVVKEWPQLFETDFLERNGYDAAVCRYEWPHMSKIEILSGTLWLNDTEGAARLVGEWVQQQKLAGSRMDQKTLRDAVELCEDMSSAKIAYLPVEYCLIFDLHRQVHPDAKPVFEHFQESRKRKAREAGMA